MKKTFLFLTFVIVLGLMVNQVVLAEKPESNTAGVSVKDRKQQILIEETGQGNFVLIKGAIITEISNLAGSTTPNLLKVKVFGQEYKIQVLSDTNVVRQNWGKLSIGLSEFSIGDIINAYGTLDSADPFLVKTKTVRDISVQKTHKVFSGNIKTITSPDTFTLEVPPLDNVSGVSGDIYTVKTTSATKIYDGKVLKAFSDLQTGMKVWVRGILNKTLSQIQALLIQIKK
jgi:hypothetical protein